MGDRVSQASRRYLFRFLPAMALYVVILVGVVEWFELSPPTGWLRYAAALLPALPLIVCSWAFVSYLGEEPDEFQRMVMMRCVVWALGGVLCITTVLGFLETFAGTPRMPLYLVFPLFACLFGLSSPFVRRAYR